LEHVQIYAVQAKTPVTLFQESSQGEQSLRVAVAFFMIFVIFFFPVIILFILFLVGLLPKENVGRCLRFGLAGIFGLALVPVELLLKARLRIGSPAKGTHRNLKFSATKSADCERRSGSQPFDDPKATLDHVQLSLENRAFRFS